MTEVPLQAGGIIPRVVRDAGDLDMQVRTRDGVLERAAEGRVKRGARRAFQVVEQAATKHGD